MSDDALISSGTTVWTSKQETSKVSEMIERRFMARAKTPDEAKKTFEDIERPICRTCGQTTCYIVELVNKIENEGQKPKYAPMKAMLGFILNYTQSSVYLDDEGTEMYIPVTVCHKCGAGRDAFNDGKYDPGRRNETLARLNTAALTFTEKEEYKTEYSKSFDKGVEKRQEWDEENPRSKARYREKRK